MRQHIMNTNDDVIRALKSARKTKGLSQSELGKRVGVPQSHISKIEKGGVDIKLSSLTQIARVLDLEVQLIPKRAIPAVESIVANFPRDRTAPALSEIRTVQKYLEHLQNSSTFAGNESEATERLSQTLKRLQALNYDTDDFVRLKKTLTPISKYLIAALNAQGTSEKKAEDFNSFLRNLERTSNSLRILRNNLAHRHEQTELIDRPAYSLDKDDD